MAGFAALRGLGSGWGGFGHRSMLAPDADGDAAKAQPPNRTNARKQHTHTPDHITNNNQHSRPPPRAHAQHRLPRTKGLERARPLSKKNLSPLLQTKPPPRRRRPPTPGGNRGRQLKGVPPCLCGRGRERRRASREGARGRRFCALAPPARPERQTSKAVLMLPSAPAAAGAGPRADKVRRRAASVAQGRASWRANGVSARAADANDAREDSTKGKTPSRDSTRFFFAL